jgi:hypothetical protein
MSITTNRLALVHASAAVLVAGVISSSSLAQDADYRIIAMSGDEAPGLGGASFTAVGVPYINEWGQVTFMSVTDDGTSTTGFWTTAPDNPQVLELIVAKGLPVPDAPGGVVFGDFFVSNHHPLVSDTGNIGFAAPLVNHPDGALGLFRRINGVLESVALAGSDIPGVPGATFVGLGNLITFNDADAMAFHGTFEGAGINGTNNEGFFAQGFGGVNLMVRKGGAAPGMPGTTIQDISNFNVQLNNDGQLAFSAATDGAHDGWAVFRGAPGLIAPVLATGDLSPFGEPYTGPGAVSGSFRQSLDGATVLADTGPEENSLLGFYFADANGTTLIARENSTNPLGSYAQLGFNGGHTNANGTAVYHAKLFGPGMNDGNDSAIFRKTQGAGPQVVAREGNQALGFDEGVVLRDLFSPGFPRFLDGTDRAYYQALVEGPGIDETNDMAVWSVDADGDYHLLLREGQMIEVSDGDSRQVESFFVSGGLGQETGRPPAANDQGDMAFQVSFTDTSNAIVVARLPVFCPADLNDDNMVDVDDLVLLVLHWGETGPIGTGGDVDQDGDTDVDDLLTLITSWGACFIF